MSTSLFIFKTFKFSPRDFIVKILFRSLLLHNLSVTSGIALHVLNVFIVLTCDSTNLENCLRSCHNKISAFSGFPKPPFQLRPGEYRAKTRQLCSDIYTVRKSDYFASISISGDRKTASLYFIQIRTT